MKTRDVKTHDDLISYLRVQTGYAHLLRKGDGRRVYDMMLNLTAFMPEHTKAKLRADYILDGITRMPPCPQCGKPLGVEKEGNRLMKTCGSEDCIAKTKRSSVVETSKQRYGTDFPNQNKEVYARGTLATMKERYGGHYTSTDEYKLAATGKKRSEETKEKISRAIIEAHRERGQEIVKKREDTYEARTGYKNPSYNPETLEKIQDSHEYRTGYRHPMKNPEVVEKSHLTNIRKYGGWFLASDQAKEARIASFGCENFFASDEFKKMREGKPHHFQNEEMLSTIADKVWCEEFITSNGLDLRKMSEISTAHVTTVLAHLERHGLYNRTDRRKSSIEQMVMALLDDNDVEYEYNKYYDGLQADFMIPEKGIAIECNGNYWHSDAHKEDSYHLKKTNHFLSLGIQVIHLFEDEILAKWDIVSAMLRSKLGIKGRSIGARSTTVVELTPKAAGEFYDTYHIQGKTKASVHYGLALGDEIVACMSFRSYGRNLKENEAELVRFATSISVIGGFSKLLKHFTRKTEQTIISYADKRISTGDVYEKNGFVCVKETPPSYYYMHRKNMYTRLRKENFKKSLIEKSPDMEYDSSLSERENMKMNGFLRIYDCGLKKFVLYP